MTIAWVPAGRSIREERGGVDHAAVGAIRGPGVRGKLLRIPPEDNLRAVHAGGDRGPDVGDRH